MIAPLYEGAKKERNAVLTFRSIYTCFYMEIVVLIGP